MMRPLAYLLTVLVLLQSFGRELLVLHFKANQTELAARYCVNKARPSLHCDGKCYLARQIRRVERGPAKAPTEGLTKVKFEVTVPTRFRLAAPAWAGQPAARRYARLAARAYAPMAPAAVFHPPILRG